MYVYIFLDRSRVFKHASAMAGKLNKGRFAQTNTPKKKRRIPSVANRLCWWVFLLCAGSILVGAGTLVVGGDVREVLQMVERIASLGIAGLFGVIAGKRIA